MSHWPADRDVVRIGNGQGRIALYLDEREAIDLAEHYGSRDLGRLELMEAVERAYPRDDDDDDQPPRAAVPSAA